MGSWETPPDAARGAENQNAHPPGGWCACEGRSAFLRGHYPDQVRRSAAVSMTATLSARLPELPLACYPVVGERLRVEWRGVKRDSIN
jgi:hypothetical protein